MKFNLSSDENHQFIPRKWISMTVNPSLICPWFYLQPTPLLMKAFKFQICVHQTLQVECYNRVSNLSQQCNCSTPVPSQLEHTQLHQYAHSLTLTGLYINHMQQYLTHFLLSYLVSAVYCMSLHSYMSNICTPTTLTYTTQKLSSLNTD
jgi:hypothetical protein